MEKLALHTTTRKVLGKKVKALRRNGITPIHVFGHGIDSLALQADTPEIEKLLRRAGATHLIALSVDKIKEKHNVMISSVQRHSVSGNLIHVDFHQIQMGERIIVSVPLHFMGDSPVAKSKSVILLRNISSIRIECLPDDIPLNIPVDITNLANVGDSIFVKELKIPGNVTLLEDPEELVIRVYRPKAEVVETPVAAAAATAEAAAAATTPKGTTAAAPEAAPAAPTGDKGTKKS